MGVYTVLDNSEIDKAIDGRLELIVSEIREKCSADIKAIVLTGGFGRGEGGVVKDNDHYRPVNDFDVNIFVSLLDYLRNGKKNITCFKELSEVLAKNINIKQIDISQCTWASFFFSPNLISRYEILHGHKILWGNINLKRIMPKLSGEELSLIDGTIYFLNRGSALLLPALYFTPGWRVDRNKRENFRIEIDKACIAMGDAILLKKKKYHYSYSERAKRMMELPVDDVPDGHGIREMYLRAINNKIKPVIGWDGDKREIEKWFGTREVFKNFFFWYESERTGVKLRDWNEFAEYVYAGKDIINDSFLKNMRAHLKTIISGNEKKNYSVTKQDCLSVLPSLLFSLKKDGRVDKTFDLVKAKLDIPDQDTKLEEWIKASKIYLSLFHPDGEISDVVRGEEKNN